MGLLVLSGPWETPSALGWRVGADAYLGQGEVGGGVSSPWGTFTAHLLPSQSCVRDRHEGSSWQCQAIAAGAGNEARSWTIEVF